MENKSNVIPLKKAKTIKPDDLPSIPKKHNNSGDGGEPPMSKEKFVTHEELGHVIDNLNNKIDLSTEKILHHTDNKFSEVKAEAHSANWKANWILGILAAAVASVVAAALMKFL